MSKASRASGAASHLCSLSLLCNTCLTSFLGFFFFKVQVSWILITHFRQTCIQKSVVNKEGKSLLSLPISSFEYWVIETHVCLLGMTQASSPGFSACRYRRGGDERCLPAAILILPSWGERELQYGQQHHPLLWYWLRLSSVPEGNTLAPSAFDLHTSSEGGISVTQDILHCYFC